MPIEFWGAQQIEHSAWMEYTARLDREHEIETLIAALGGASRVLDVGGGTGQVTQRLAARFDKVTVVEPSAAQYSRILPPSGKEIEVVPGRAEALPVRDGVFDAVVATWILPYTSDPMLAVAELARAAADTAGATVCVSQAAPGNVLVEIYNLQAQRGGRPPAHHGFLLAGAIDVLEMRGFSVSLAPFTMSLGVAGGDAAEAASLLQRLHFIGHPRAEAMRQLTTPLIAEQLARTPGSLPADGVLLVARRG
jgi:SAM-dependent methyltransferase